MRKYYTRACNFYYGQQSKFLIKKKKTLPLCSNKEISFDKIEILHRKKNRVYSKLIKIKDIKKLNKKLRNLVNQDLKNIVTKRKNFLKNINFLKPNIMGILNLTPDSFSDGGKFKSK